MGQTLKLAKNLQDNGFGLFRTMLQYKLEERGKVFVKIDRFYPSSKLCSYCGYPVISLYFTLIQFPEEPDFVAVAFFGNIPFTEDEVVG